MDLRHEKTPLVVKNVKVVEINLIYYYDDDDYDYQVGQKVLVRKDGILHKTESRYETEPWMITSVHTNGTVRVQCRNKSERMNIRRVKPFEE